jgi:hypothetical protein
MRLVKYQSNNRINMINNNSQEVQGTISLLKKIGYFNCEITEHGITADGKMRKIFVYLNKQGQKPSQEIIQQIKSIASGLGREGWIANWSINISQGSTIDVDWKNLSEA